MQDLSYNHVSLPKIGIKSDFDSLVEGFFFCRFICRKAAENQVLTLLINLLFLDFDSLGKGFVFGRFTGRKAA